MLTGDIRRPMWLSGTQLVHVATTETHAIPRAKKPVIAQQHKYNPKQCSGTNEKIRVAKTYPPAVTMHTGLPPYMSDKMPAIGFPIMEKMNPRANMRDKSRSPI